MYRIVIGRLNDDRQPIVVIMDNLPEKDAKKIAKLFCSKHWAMNRRPDTHTFGDHAYLKVERMPVEG